MANYVDRFPIDPEKLEAIIARRGLKKSNIAKVCGFNPTMFSKAYNRGYFMPATVIQLEQYFNIRYKDYASAEKDEVYKPTEDKRQFAAQDNNKTLYEIIYKAVFDAMTDVFKS